MFPLVVCDVESRGSSLRCVCNSSHGCEAGAPKHLMHLCTSGVQLATACCMGVGCLRMHVARMVASIVLDSGFVVHASEDIMSRSC